MNRLRWAIILVGLALAIAALRVDDRRLTWAAIAALCLALALRFATPRPGAIPDDAAEDEPPASQ